MRKERLLLLNLPGTQVYLRDYFCSKISQADYLLPPVDLLYQSGFLSHDYEVALVDAIASRMSIDDVFEYIHNFRPGIIVFLAGAASWDEDRSFIERLAKQFPKIRLIGMGDVFLEAGLDILSALPKIEAVSCGFTTDDLRLYLSDAPYNKTRIMRLDQKEGEEGNDVEHRREYSIPIPRHELFIENKYRYPFIRGRKFCVVLTDYGCPFRCSFCVMPSLGYKQRALQNVVDELEYIRELGIRDLMFLDQTFGTNKKRTEQLLEAMATMRFRWTAFSRVDVLSEKMAKLMKKAGCHTLILGVESGNEQLLRSNRKDYSKEQIRRAFQLCRQEGIRTVGTFILGLPEETHETIRETFSFIREIRPDFCSFNVAVPRQGTELRQEAMEFGLASADALAMDQSGTKVSMPTLGLTQEEVNRYLQEAISMFYLRPSYLMKRLVGIRSIHEFAILMRQGWGVILRYFRLRYTGAK